MLMRSVQVFTSSIHFIFAFYNLFTFFFFFFKLMFHLIISSSIIYEAL